MTHSELSNADNVDMNAFEAMNLVEGDRKVWMRHGIHAAVCKSLIRSDNASLLFVVGTDAKTGERVDGQH